MSTNNLYMNVSSSIIRKCQTIETTPMSIIWWINKMYCIYIMGYNLVTERNKVLICAVELVNLENIMLSKISQKGWYCMIPLIWSVHNRQIHRDTEWISDCQGLRGVDVPFWGDENIQKLGIYDDCTTLWLY